MIESIEPSTGLTAATFCPDGDAEVNVNRSAAVDAQRLWRRVPVGRRADLLVDVARILRGRREEYAQLITTEMGKPIAESRAEVNKRVLTVEHYASNAATFLAARNVPNSSADTSIVLDPLGVVLAIMPWDYPFWQFFRFAPPALIAGNTTVLKHANNVPQCARAIGDPRDDATQIGPIARPNLRQALHQQVKETLKNPHVKLKCGGEPVEGHGNYYLVWAETGE